MASKQRLKLLTYPMALMTTPPPQSSLWAAGASGSSESGANSQPARRWVRDPSELCVSGMFRHSKTLTEYVAKYKFDDPNWNSILELPCGNPISMEMRGRHCNTALRHIVQKGHALYFICASQHTVLHPKGVIEQSHVTCSIGIRGERLRTSIIHEGPVDAAERNGPRAVLGISQVEGYATWFQRKPMLWQRSRRIGGLQAHLGAYDWTMLDPQDVGRQRDTEVMLLGSPHTNMVGGGCNSTGIVSSINISQHPFLFLGEFDAPALTAIEAVQQTAHLVAQSNQLVSKPRPSSVAGGATEIEPLHALGWVTVTPPPYVPLESDLPFQIQMARPNVYTSRDTYPSTVIGNPFHDGAPVMMVEYNMRQGAEHYLYDDSPSSRPTKWWSQKANFPYSGMMWLAREGNLEHLVLRDTVHNPFDRERRRTALHRTVAPTLRARKRAARYAAAKRRTEAGTPAAASSGREVAGESPSPSS
ncbi:Hypothetical protein, putative [Bodo saltans]|uniref:Uncharacterized protein n=1 Tax=Bodo saltans TaxID=75058 RepID=A0A0S4J8S1_BODSA|nr:Hypothetical protein, putative [Bodo saltans]|eukprot:CUG71412.1 Hypothetical protein, putative [Bodo saltans]